MQANHTFNFLTISILIVAAIFLILASPMPQPLSYHDFADKRSMFGIPNFINVVSNIPFLILGSIGLYLVKRGKTMQRRFQHKKEQIFYSYFFCFIILAGLGSAYYHLDPNNLTFFFDRFPVALAFMAFFCAIVAERISFQIGLLLLYPLMFLGGLSVVYWEYTELKGCGDLKFYGVTQTLPFLLTPLMLLYKQMPYTETKYLWECLTWAALFKVCEILDVPIFKWTSNTISGHTLKHITASLCVYAILKHIKRRR